MIHGRLVIGPVLDSTKAREKLCLVLYRGLLELCCLSVRSLLELRLILLRVASILRFDKT